MEIEMVETTNILRLVRMRQIPREGIVQAFGPNKLTKEDILYEVNGILESKNLPQIEKVRVNGLSAEGYPQVNCDIWVFLAQNFNFDFLPAPFRDISFTLPDERLGWLGSDLIASLEIFCSFLRRNGFLGEILDWPGIPGHRDEDRSINVRDTQEKWVERRFWERIQL